MKKLTVLIVMALALSLASCTAKKVEEEKPEDVKTEESAPSENETPEEPELPWADGPVETPMIPPEFMEESEIPEEPAEQPEVPVEPAEPTEPEQTEGPELDEKELPILQIVPEENETPAIPIN